MKYVIEFNVDGIEECKIYNEKKDDMITPPDSKTVTFGELRSIMEDFIESLKEDLRDLERLAEND